MLEFEQQLEGLRSGNHIPAVSVVIAKDQRIVWTKGFGTADLTSGRPATDSTVYHLASLTKPFAATLILQLVEAGKVSLDDPVANYGISLPAPTSGVIRVRHLMSHTSSGTPGTVYSYDGNRFGQLDAVIAQASGKTFAALLQERIIGPLALKHTAPNPQVAAFAASGVDAPAFLSNFAKGYRYDRSTYVPTAYPSYFGTAAGLIASATDVATFSMAIDRNAFFREETRALAFAPVVSTKGDTLPYGLGWFSTRYRGVRVVWHYGLWTAISSLIVKVPDRGLTFVVLGNTDALSAPYQLGGGKLENSPWARAFLDAFVLGNAALPSG
jgi:CubicO group peptidase (beta-lactamase class C family)